MYFKTDNGQHADCWTERCLCTLSYIIRSPRLRRVSIRAVLGRLITLLPAPAPNRALQRFAGRMVPGTGTEVRRLGGDAAAPRLPQAAVPTRAATFAAVAAVAEVAAVATARETRAGATHQMATAVGCHLGQCWRYQRWTGQPASQLQPGISSAVQPVLLACGGPQRWGPG